MTKPDYIVIDTADAIRTFERRVQQCMVVEYNVPHLLCQILASLVEAPVKLRDLEDLAGACVDTVKGIKLADEKVLADCEVLNNAIFELATSIYHKFVDLRLYINGRLNYYYSDLLGKDLVIAKLPY